MLSRILTLANNDKKVTTIQTLFTSRVKPVNYYSIHVKRNNMNLRERVPQSYSRNKIGNFEERRELNDESPFFIGASIFLVFSNII